MRGGGRSPNNLRGGPGQYNLCLPISTHIFLQFLCETGKSHKCTKLKGKMIINVTLCDLKVLAKLILSILFFNFLYYQILLRQI